MKLTLRALRAASGHSAAWCAENIGHASKRTWSYWENGRNGSFPKVPDDVMQKMLALASAVQKALAQTKGKKMKMDVKLFDHPHLTADEIERAENAAADILAQYPLWLLKEIQEDDRKMLDAGVERAERGASAWKQIEDAAYSSALAALHVEKWHRIPEEMHLEFSFWE